MGRENNYVIGQGKTALVIDGKDNVGIALVDIDAGETCIVRLEEKEITMKVLDHIPFGHKFALTSIKKDDPVFKYGEEIGKMSTAVEKGAWVHSHNMYCERGMK
ncbi:UxaA family hydrolase [Evansella sp. AB-P1]|uniref:UxaA family hydrolase n=1 Tax=Evansella sp. AB-P1 TaxID=3037653 RepID=UPI00241F55AF|nr:UxaA family hydrolase [Evansella sp. AB-P1]MDG5787189.1 UxaA family hydrolase [Evansella sp. AB-P1]